MSSKDTIAIKEYWPNLKVAEHEVLARIETSLLSLGFKLLKIDQNGYRNDTGELIQEQDALFCLDLHFVTPRVFPGISVAALWNPSDFYKFFGLERSLRNQFSHNFFVAANPRAATGLLSIAKPEYGREIIQLNHTVPESFLEPVEAGPKGIFYIGIGWDKTAMLGQRHGPILRELDKGHLLKIYGPAKLADGTRPWSSFSSYSGDLPFDGHSVLNAANERGLVLALSSESHLAAGISSNRIFEAIAAGCLPIYESNLEAPFDLSEGIQIENTQTVREISEFLDSTLRHLVANPGEFHSRVKALQNRMSEQWTLEKQLSHIIKEVKLSGVQDGELSKTFKATNLFQKFSSFFSLEKCDQSQIVKKINSPLFNRFLREEILNGDSDWIYWASSGISEESMLKALERAEQGVEVLHVPAIKIPNKGFGEAVDLTISKKYSGDAVLDSIAVNAQLAKAWFNHQSGLMTLASLFALLKNDYKSHESVLNHKVDQLSLIRQKDNDIVWIGSLLDSWDAHLLNQAEILHLDPRLTQVVANQSKQLGHSQPLQILDYHAVLRALSQIPSSEFPRLLFRTFAVLVGKLLRGGDSKNGNQRNG